MKTRYTNFAMRLVMMVAVVMMAANAWGAKTGTIYFGTTTGYTRINAASVTGNDDLGNTWKVLTTGTTSYTGQASYYQVGKSSEPATSITFGVKLPAVVSVTSFSAKFGGFSNTAGSIALKVTNKSTSSESTIGSGSLSATSDVTVSNSTTATGDSLTVTVTSIAKGVKCYYITYTYGNTSAYTVTFSANSAVSVPSPLTEGSANSGVTLPSVTPSSAVTAAGWGFYGWATSSSKPASETTTVPTIVGKAGDTHYPNENETVYAVYAKGTYTKVTSTSDIIVGSGEKYLIMGYDDNCSDEGCGMYVMTHKSFIDGSDYEYMYGFRLGDAPSDSYSAAVIHADWRYEITKSTSYYYFQNIATSKYVDTDNSSTRIYVSSKVSNDKYVITFSSNGYCTIKNNSEYYGFPYLNVYDGDGAFSNGSSGWEKMMIYKETTTAKYNCDPCTNIVSLTKGTQTNATISSFSLENIETCSSTDADRQVTVTVAAATGYEFLSTARLTFTKTSGTASATYVSGPTGTGSYTWVYRFTKDDSGAGTFSVTSATPKSYTVTLNDNSGSGGDGTKTVTYNANTNMTSAVTIPTKTDYIFGGYWTSANSGVTLDTKVIDSDGTWVASVSGYTDATPNWIYAGNVTLYAKWTEHTYVNYRTNCCTKPTISVSGTGKSVEDGKIVFSVLRDDLGGNSDSEWKEVAISISSNSDGEISIVEGTSGDAGKTAMSLSTWQSRAETGGTWAVASTHAEFVEGASAGEYTFRVKSTAKNNKTGQGTYRIGITQAADGDYCESTVWIWVDVTLRDKFVDAVNGNTTINRDGQNSTITTPAESAMDEDLNDACHDTTRRLLGWVKETDLDTWYNNSGASTRVSDLDDKKNDAKLVAPNTSGIYPTGVTWYAVWGEEVAP